MTTTEIGRRAEDSAAAFLVAKGCEIVARNWRTRFCEIDIVAVRGRTVYFCEVKYRSHTRQGVGLDYITPAKLRRMRFAAESWMYRYGWHGGCQLCAIEVSGLAFRVTAAVKGLG